MSTPREVLMQQRRQLPIFSAQKQLVHEILTNDSTVIVGETGSGKTTQLPQFLRAAGLCRQGIVGITQPRRVAAMTISERVAEEVGVPLGGEVGYTIRFDDKSSEKTRIKYLTDGMLLREAMIDPLLERYSTIILDEAHERTINTDMLFGVLKSVQKNRAAQADVTSTEGEERAKKSRRRLGKLKLIIMSATLDADAFSRYFDAKVIYVEGRQFPVDVYYSAEPQQDWLDAALVTALQIHVEEPPGDILIFLTGREDIESLEELLLEKRKKFTPEMNDIEVCPIYAGLSPEEQLKAFAPCPPQCRKIILATNIAETSITINGIKYVIDTGMVKSRSFDSRAGVDSLKVVPVSKAAARQRTGRAGRESSGTCYRLYTEEDFYKLEDNTVPEIQRCNLSSVILQMKALGIEDVLNFDYMDKPPKLSIQRALEELLSLGALSPADGTLSTFGKKMAELPVLPSFAKVLLASKDFKCSEEVLSIISMLSTETDSVFVTPKSKKKEALEARKRFMSSDGDHITLLNVYNNFIQSKHSKRWCIENFLNFRALQKAVDVRRQLKEYTNKLGVGSSSCGRDLDEVKRCFITGFFTNIALIQHDNSYKTITENKICYIHPSSVLHGSKQPYVMYNEVVFTTKFYLRDCMTMEPAWLEELAPHFYTKIKVLNKPTMS
ncbi:hypothetical protein PROFUN_07052 [Planoprotostelium fungivorum]|uniref:RNA helicase n=1 Tax=Planoprotostelium fungivorum TaxID=1890364 RepID=A0A2P6NMZ3_9EUKA|nr:hypothetical protein PROFUN_07052 [Planoprotostelium fungivorum]